MSERFWSRTPLAYRPRVLPLALLLALPLGAVAPAPAQGRGTPAASAVQAAATSPEQAQALFKDLRWRNIGPANMAGRISHIDAVESNPAIVYMGAASGGVWKSVNAGTTWEPVFTGHGSANIGAIAIFQPNPDIVWVATGEACVRNSVAWGDGIYKSTDGGKTFTNMGLRDSHHIDEVVTHPSNPDIVWVASQGHLWDTGGERGIYKTTDGGRTWRQMARGLPNRGNVGASDLVIDPRDPNVLYVGLWERIRRPYNFESGGANGGIFKSTDGGESWSKLTTGLPGGPTGKIGLAIARSDSRVLNAIVEHGFQPGRNDSSYADMTRLGSGIYRSEDGGATWTYVNRFNNRPFYYSHLWIDPNEPRRLYVLATSAYVSEDGGRTFDRTLPSGIAGDYHAMWIDPANSDRFYIGNDKGGYVSYDRGFNYVMFDNMDIGQFYAISVDNRDPYWVYGGLQDNGNWGGPSNSKDYNGILNDHWFKFHAGDGFHATVDPNDWRTVYTEAQGGNIRRLDAVYRQVGKSVTPTAATVVNYDEVAPVVAARTAGPGGAGGGAGGPGGGGAGRLPREHFRFNWSTPILLSPHDSRTIYYAGNRLFKSTDRGDSWRVISPDLSTNDPVLTNPESGGLTRDVTGAETHGTAITIAESPLVPGVIWVGTDDGNIQLTRDDGKTWTNVRGNIPTTRSPIAANGNGRAQGAARGVPARTWVSRVEASRFDAATAYVSFDGHRSGDMRPYVWKTTDFGRTWMDITANLPGHEPVYVVKEDPKNSSLLFAGTEFSVHASVDGGRSWHRLMNGMPTVAVHDLVIHPRDGDLIAGTHGRSVWILDDISPLQQLTPAVLASDVHLFENRVATQWKGISRGATRGHMLFTGRNPLTVAQRPPGNSPSELATSATVSFYLRNAPAGPARLEIASLDGTQTFTAEIPATAGVNRYFWNMRFAPAETRVPAEAAPPGGGGFGGFRQQGVAAVPGTYRIKLTVGGRTQVGTLTIRDDPEASKIGS
ncbi:MAG TPA: hypothetical protein VMM18_18165 [Gemmatimonadaceae bacterium]|nr:hypothetical protein [Gemmatimonadaceae bacterium]